MKCKNCGGNYRTKELVCPYCGTQNIIGHIWMAQRSEAELEYERARKAAGRYGSIYVAYRVLNRILLIAALIFLGIMCLCFLAYGVENAYINIYRKTHAEQITDTLEQYYEAGDFRAMHRYMARYDLYGNEYYAYTQAVILNTNYEEYLAYMLKFLALDEEKKQKDTYYLSFALKNSSKVYCLDCGIYSELDIKNEEIYMQRRQEILAFWQGTLGLHGEEIALLTKEDGYIDYDAIQQLQETVKERRAWQ